jgi:hypothetical protein
LSGKYFAGRRQILFAIGGIFLGRQKDKQIWVGTKNGDFSAQSAYHLAKGSVEAENGSSFNNDHVKALWRVVWGVKVPRVVQHFLWKACNNILPTKENQHKRVNTADSLCPLCKKETETVSHIIWSCESAKDV